MKHAVDRLVFTPDDVDLSRSPLAGRLDAETYVLGAFNPGMTRLPNGNLLLMVRVAEALRKAQFDGHVHAIRWHDGDYVLDAWSIDHVDTADPRKFMMRGGGWKVMALTSLSWLLPVEMSPDGLDIVAVHYDRAIVPRASYQCYGVEDARISRVGERWLMTTCSVSPERHSTTLYTSDDALDWRLEGIVLDHQNKDMLIFEGLVDEKYWAQTRPLGDLYFAYPPGAEWRAGPSINLASSPDALHWKPHDKPGIRPHAATLSTARMGGGTPPILTDRGWLSLWHGVEPSGVVGIYRTYWSILDRDDPSVTVATSHPPLLEPAPELTEPLKSRMYLDNVVFTTGIADAGDHYVVASGEADLACRITHVDKAALTDDRPAPLIVTATFGAADHAYLDGLRRAHFPPERNQLAAHLTLFHHLSPDVGPELKRRLVELTRGQPAPRAWLGGVMSLGRGVAFRVESLELEAIRGDLADAFASLLTPQDRAGWRPHVTIQNKVEPAVARVLHGELSAGFVRRPLAIAGLASWWYRGGPWEVHSAHKFA